MFSEQAEEAGKALPSGGEPMKCVNPDKKV